MIGNQAALWLSGVLLVGNVLQGVWVAHLKADLHSARAAQSRAEGERDTALARGSELQVARDGWEQVSIQRGQLLIACQAENVQVRQANTHAVAQLQTDLADAERTLDAFMGRYQQAIRQPECGQALTQLDVACPTLEDY